MIQIEESEEIDSPGFFFTDIISLPRHWHNRPCVIRVLILDYNFSPSIRPPLPSEVQRGITRLPPTFTTISAGDPRLAPCKSNLRDSRSHFPSTRPSIYIDSALMLKVVSLHTWVRKQGCTSAHSGHKGFRRRWDG